jgi:putative SOS response-associated peptidase YedK
MNRSIAEQALQTSPDVVKKPTQAHTDQGSQTNYDLVALEDDALAGPHAMTITYRRNRSLLQAQITEHGEHLLYGFLTTAANSVVPPIHKKAMPVILRTAEECNAWLTADPAEALKMQRPLPDDALKIVATGEKEDPPAAAAHREDVLPAAPELPL